MATTTYTMYNTAMRGPLDSVASETPRKRRPPNFNSLLLNDDENHRLLSELGPDAVCLSAGVAELLRDNGGKWSRVLRGVICLIKDYQHRSYYLRLFDIAPRRELWEFRLYKNFQALMYPPHLLTFEGEVDGVVYGLNFSSPREAETFKEHLEKRLEQERKTGASRGNTPRGGTSLASSSTLSTSSSQPRSFAAAHQPPPPPAQSPFNATGVAVGYPVSTMKSADNGKGGATLFGKKKGGKDNKKKKIRKEDISNPTNFQHKAHVGWDQDKGFSNEDDSAPLDETVRDILMASGHDPSQLSKKTIKFVYDFIDKYQEPGHPAGTTISAPFPSTPHTPQTASAGWPRSSPAAHAPPPPPPTRAAAPSIPHTLPSLPPSRPPPPPPSASRPTNSAPPSTTVRPPLPTVPAPTPNGRPMGGPPLPPVSHSSPPPPPPPPLPPVSSGAPPPPPPPPMGAPSGGGPPPPPPPANNSRGNLLAEIQAGKALKSVADQQERKSGGGADTRDDVMAQIRQGTTLRHVDAGEKEKRKSGGGVGDVGGLAGALARALEERRQNMGLNEDSSDADSENDWSD